MIGSAKTNPQRYENTILKYLEKTENNLSKQLLFWILGKSFINNYYLVCKWTIQGLSRTVKSEKVLIWFEIINSLCDICTSNQNDSKTLQLLSIFFFIT